MDSWCYCPFSSSCPYLSLVQPKKGGGISFNSTVTLTQCSEKLVQLILHEYSILGSWFPGSSWMARWPGDIQKKDKTFGKLS